MPIRRYKPEQIVNLLRGIEVEIANGKKTPEVVREAGINVQTGDTGARTWLETRTSYLDQYLKSNFEQFTVRVYGVSAQGGDLKADRELLLNFDSASDRILIEGPDCRPHDISEPVRWCLGLGDRAAH